MSNGIKNIVVTGSEGFIGSHVCLALQTQGHCVFGYDILNGYDITTRHALNLYLEPFKPDWIVHLAAQVFLKPSLEDPQNDAMTNIIGTLNILEAAQRNKCGVVFSSSGAVYGNNYQYPEPISPYGLSKLTAERYCQLYHQLYDIPVVVFRFSSVYGIGRQKTSVNLIVDKALKGEVIEVTGDGEQTRDFTHISDVVEAIIMAINGRFPSGIYDIGTGVSTSINDLIKLIEENLGKKLKIHHTGVCTVGDPKRNELNVSKAARHGFKAKISLAEGIKQLIEEMRN